MIEKLIHKFLSESYQIEDEEIISISTDNVMFISQIEDELSLIFGLDILTNQKYIKSWCINHGLNEYSWNLNNQFRTFTYSIWYFIYDIVGQQYTPKNFLETIYHEIRNQQVIFSEDFYVHLRDIITHDDFKTLIRAFGFIPKEVYNGRNQAESMTYKEKMNERQNNPYWQYYVRTEKHYQEAQQTSFLEANRHGFNRWGYY